MNPLFDVNYFCRRIERHIKEFFVFVTEPQTPPGHQPQGQRRHPAGRGQLQQDDFGLIIRHLAPPRTKSSRRMPITPHYPANLNSCSPLTLSCLSGPHGSRG